MGGRLPSPTQSGAGHEVPAEAPGGPPPESVQPEGDHSHVRLNVADLERLLAPAQPPEPV
jgi:hypothetical protein